MLTNLAEQSQTRAPFFDFLMQKTELVGNNLITSLIQKLFIIYYYFLVAFNVSLSIKFTFFYGANIYGLGEMQHTTWCWRMHTTNLILTQGSMNNAIFICWCTFWAHHTHILIGTSICRPKLPLLVLKINLVGLMCLFVDGRDNNVY